MATTPLRGDRAAHDMAFADLHATDIENEEFEYHVPPASAQTVGHILKATATGWVAGAETGGSVVNFPDLGDVPAAYTGEAGKVVAVKGTEDGLEFVEQSVGVANFIELGDVPAAYTGEAGKVVAVNAGETALEFITPAGGVPGFQDISITGAGTATWDLAGGSAEITLDGNTTIGISNPGSVEGLIVFLKVATSNPAYTLAFDTPFYFPNGIIPVISPINADILTFACDGTNLYNIAHVQELDTAFSPDLLEDLMLDLDADTITGSEDDPIGTWADASGNGYDYESADNAYRPLLKLASINGHKSLLFDNTDDALVDATGIPMGYSGLTTFLVAKAASTTSSEHDVLTDGGTNRVFYDDTSWNVEDAYGTAYLGPSPVTNPIAITIRKEFGQDNYVVGQYRANGVQDGIRANAALDYGFGVGNSGGTKHANAYITRIIVYARALTDREMQGVERYLMARYGIS